MLTGVGGIAVADDGRVYDDAAVYGGEQEVDVLRGANDAAAALIRT